MLLWFVLGLLVGTRQVGIVRIVLLLVGGKIGLVQGLVTVEEVARVMQNQNLDFKNGIWNFFGVFEIGGDFMMLLMPNGRGVLDSDFFLEFHHSNNQIIAQRTLF